jgi:hypothetical protein
LPTFTTTSRDVARRFRTAWLANLVINADVLGASFAKAKVCSVKRDPRSASGRWSIEVEEAKSDWVPIFVAGLAVPILDLNVKKTRRSVRG